MKPRDSQSKSPQENLFQSRLDQQLNPNHPLFRLAQQIDWGYFEFTRKWIWVDKALIEGTCLPAAGILRPRARLDNGI
jgi:hypothetical protein